MGSENGTAHIGYSAQTSDSYTGDIDEVIVEARVWAAAEIRKYYTQARGMFVAQITM